MADYQLLLHSLRDFAQTMSSPYDLNEMSFDLCNRTVEVLSATGSGVTVATASGELRFLTASSESMLELEKIQETGQQGPCVEAFRSQKPLTIADIRETNDWPEYTAVATRVGLHAVVGYPLTFDGQRLGALNLYNEQPREWTDEDLDVLGVLADMATAYFVRASQLAEARLLAEQLQVALDSRVVIEQAKGILAGEHGVRVDEAFEVLRGHARANNLKLRELSHAVVNMGLRIPRN